MIVVRGKDVERYDVGKLLRIPIMEGVKIQWLIHKRVGDEKYGHRFATRLYTVPPGKMFPLHFHKYVEAAHILSGRINFENETEAVELGPGDIIYTYSDEPHGSTVISNEPAQVLCCIDCLDEATCDPEKQAQVIKS